MPGRALVACVGNPLVGDDAAGCRVHERLAAGDLDPAVSLRELTTAGIALVDELDGESVLVVVDAVQFGAAPGTVHVVGWDDLAASGACAVSAHGVGVREALDVAARLFPERLPRRAFLVGIEGENFDGLGEPLSPAVAAAIQPAADVVKQLVGTHLI
jgi:hydrogenase maturation protease